MTWKRDGLLLESHEEPARDAGLALSLEDTLSGFAPVYRQLRVGDERIESAAVDLQAGLDVDMVASELDADKLDEQAKKLRRWKRLLLGGDIDNDFYGGSVGNTDDTVGEGIVRAYRLRVNEEIAKVHILQASKAGNMRSFMRWNKFVYGKPDERLYRAALDFVAADADDLIDEYGIDSVQGKAAENVLNMVGGKRGDRRQLMPDEDTFKSVSEDHMRVGGYYALLLAGVEIPKDRISQCTGRPLIEQVLNNLESDYVIDEVDGSVWSVDHGNQAVNQPHEYSLLNKRFRGLVIGHEIGSHILEKINGRRGPLRLAETGLDRYELGNEGRAVVREQVVYDTFEQFSKTVRWRDILRRHMAISYACGVADDTSRTSAETYKFMNTIDRMYQIRLNPDDIESAVEKAEKKTKALILRVLKGTDGSGGAYSKDLIYLQGNVGVWNVAKDSGPEVISEGDYGKFDITNYRHTRLLEAVGLIASR